MRRKNLERLIINYERRLQKLKEQQSKYGLDTPPQILIDIEDIEAAIEELQAELEALEYSSVNWDYLRALSELAEDTSPKQWVQIYFQGDFSSISEDRRSAAIDAFAAAIGISPEAIRVYRVYEGSIVFNLGIPLFAIQSLRSRLQSNSAQLRLLMIERVVLQRESGGIEVWVNKQGEFNLIDVPYFAENLSQQMILALSNAVMDQILSLIERIDVKRDQGTITKPEERQPIHSEIHQTPRRLTKSNLTVLKRVPRKRLSA